VFLPEWSFAKAAVAFDERLVVSVSDLGVNWKIIRNSPPRSCIAWC